MDVLTAGDDADDVIFEVTNDAEYRPDQEYFGSSPRPASKKSKPKPKSKKSASPGTPKPSSTAGKAGKSLFFVKSVGFLVEYSTGITVVYV